MHFDQLIQNPAMLENLNQIGFSEATPIQEKALPFVLAKKDVLALAKTGSGKTVAFGLPLLLGLPENSQHIGALVLTPTRELANQVAGELRKLARFRDNIKILTLYGGAKFGPQLGSLRHGADIIVGTPGRILAHIKKGSLLLNHAHTVVLDEADRMLDMGFFDDVESILKETPSQRQTLLFSATFDPEILEFSKKIQRDRIVVEVTEKNNQIIEEFFWYERDALEKLLKHYRPESAIIFCNMKITCDEVERRLQALGFNALAIHGDLEQADRDDALLKFANKSCTFLIATDVAARGLDIKDITMIINYDIPNTADIYTHRIGRTGRMDKAGLAVSLLRDIPDFLNAEPKDIASLEITNQKAYAAQMQTICIDIGKRHKIRAGDILGALIKEVGIEAQYIGKINIADFYSYVAIDQKFAQKAFELLKVKKIKNKGFRLWLLS